MGMALTSLTRSDRPALQLLMQQGRRRVDITCMLLTTACELQRLRTAGCAGATQRVRSGDLIGER
jgi:hypothetical protein